MAVAIVTGSGGLVGSETVRRAVERGYDVVGIENDSRAYFFGPEASTAATTARLEELDEFFPVYLDIRDRGKIDSVFARYGSKIELVVHTAAQPSHDWAAREPLTDFGINAVGTLNLLEATRARSPDATFAYLSTSKVYGDLPNYLPFDELPTRLDLPPEHPYYLGIDTSLSIDQSTHSLFGVSKASADLLVQEYGRYFGIPTVCFRPGCVSGAAHAGVELHGFLAYLMKAVVTRTPYRVIGYEGKQVRDNIDGGDLAEAIFAFASRPAAGAVYNIGGSREANCSVLEAIELVETISGEELDYSFVDEPRIGDHRWWISDIEEFRADFPYWSLTRDVEGILEEIYDENVDRWTAELVR